MLTGSLWRLPLLTAFAAFALYVAVEDTDICLWLTFVVVPVAALVLLVVVIDVIVAKSHRRTAGAVALSAAAFVLVWIGVQFTCISVRDEIRFLAWAATNPAEAVADSHQDGLVKHWETTGFLDMSNDTYLVSDPTNALAGASTTMLWTLGATSPAKAAVAERWRRARGLACDIVTVEALGADFYFVKTSGCAFWSEPVRRP
jgi:hypothetical protein